MRGDCHAEGVTARRDIGVIRCTSRPGFLPTLVKPLKLVPEPELFRFAKIDRRLLKLEFAFSEVPLR